MDRYHYAFPQARSEYDHAAACTQFVSVDGKNDVSQNARSSECDPDRTIAYEERDPGNVSQRLLPWQRRLWRSGCKPGLLRQGCVKADACAVCLSCRTAQRAGVLRSG